MSTAVSNTIAYESHTDFSHVKPEDTQFLPGGLRDFFVYRDLGVAKANMPPDNGTGWHYHVAEFQIVIMLKGWARFMYGETPTLVSAGDCVHQKPGIIHYLFDYSPDMEYLEIVGPADFESIAVDGPCAVPQITPWVK